MQPHVHPSIELSWRMMAYWGSLTFCPYHLSTRGEKAVIFSVQSLKIVTILWLVAEREYCCFPYISYIQVSLWVGYIHQEWSQHSIWPKRTQDPLQSSPLISLHESLPFWKRFRSLSYSINVIEKYWNNCKLLEYFSERLHCNYAVWWFYIYTNISIIKCWVMFFDFFNKEG